MQIQWYPGHMHKAQKAVRDILPQVDLIIEVLDARIPFSSENPMIAQLRGDKPTLKILNKSDLADTEKVKQWQDYFAADKTIHTLTLNVQQADRKERILTQIKKMIPRPTDSVKIIHALILGIPNVGKSTLINALANRTIAKTGNEPAVTKILQRIKLDKGITLFDSPGLLWPNIENSHSGYRLAITGGIKETAFELPDIASYAAEYWLQNYPEPLKQRYQLDELPTEGSSPEITFLEQIGKDRGCLVSGGRINLDKISRIFINELREGLLGPFCLELPENKTTETQQLEEQRKIKAANKQARLDARKKKQQKRRH